MKWPSDHKLRCSLSVAAGSTQAKHPLASQAARANIFVPPRINTTKNMANTSSRIRGSLYGTAVVDALGGPVEFHRRGTFAPVTSYRFNENFGLKPGTWTDDTSTMLCLAQSLVEKAGIFVIHDQIRKYVDWYQNGYMSATSKCFDIGNATRHSLEIWSESTRKVGGINASELKYYQNLVDRGLNHKVDHPEDSFFFAH